jgi:cyclopropane fatty-acyl-phospholipid synthase-like methyltransferase
MARELYTQGKYAVRHPRWHAEDSQWKAQKILEMLRRNDLTPRSICEVGCGAGEVLKQLHDAMGPTVDFVGYEISPQAFELCQTKAGERLRFHLKDILQDEEAYFDLVLLIDLIEHLEDYFTFLRQIADRSRYKILHVPLDLSVQSTLRARPIVECRETVGHLHYFTKEIVFEVLKDVGYEVLDHFYTAWSTERPALSRKALLLRLPRRLLFRAHQDLAVRLLGGYSLIVLAR